MKFNKIFLALLVLTTAKSQVYSMHANDWQEIDASDATFDPNSQLKKDIANHKRLALITEQDTKAPESRSFIRNPFGTKTKLSNAVSAYAHDNKATSFFTPEQANKFKSLSEKDKDSITNDFFIEHKKQHIQNLQKAEKAYQTEFDNFKNNQEKSLLQAVSERETEIKNNYKKIDELNQSRQPKTGLKKRLTSILTSKTKTDEEINADIAKIQKDNEHLVGENRVILTRVKNKLDEFNKTFTNLQASINIAGQHKVNSFIENIANLRNTNEATMPTSIQSNRDFSSNPTQNEHDSANSFRENERSDEEKNKEAVFRSLLKNFQDPEAKELQAMTNDQLQTLANSLRTTHGQTSPEYQKVFKEFMRRLNKKKQT
jgi:hypothetical protein